MGEWLGLAVTFTGVTSDGFALEAFDYDLPPEAIGQVPAEPRDSARLLIDGDPIRHATVADLAGELQSGDLLVVNDTKVLPARFHLHKATGGAVEVLLLEPTGQHREWRALVRPGKRLRVGTALELDGEPVMEIVDHLDDGRRVVRLLTDDLVERAGEVPLPPYITTQLTDPARYQTVYANDPGSVAAPTAGLHLTNDVFDALAAKGVQVATVDLRVGLGTFRPISTNSVLDHEMHAETYRISPETWAKVQAADRVVAVGTTSVRTLESAAATGELEGSTNLFIHRGFDWQVVDVLLTNFHVPKSSLLVMIDAFVGERWRTIYETALAEGYRFLSFGDAMLLHRVESSPLSE